MNRIFAKKAAVPAMNPKPRTPAIIAIRRKVSTKPNILPTSFVTPISRSKLFRKLS